MSVRRWVLLVLVLLLVVGLLGYARGREHHRGSQVGASSTMSAAV